MDCLGFLFFRDASMEGEPTPVLFFFGAAISRGLLPESFLDFFIMSLLMSYWCGALLYCTDSPESTGSNTPFVQLSLQIEGSA